MHRIDRAPAQARFTSGRTWTRALCWIGTSLKEENAGRPELLHAGPPRGWAHTRLERMLCHHPHASYGAPAGADCSVITSSYLHVLPHVMFTATACSTPAVLRNHQPVGLSRCTLRHVGMEIAQVRVHLAGCVRGVLGMFSPRRSKPQWTTGSPPSNHEQSPAVDVDRLHPLGSSLKGYAGGEPPHSFSFDGPVPPCCTHARTAVIRTSKHLGLAGSVSV